MFIEIINTGSELMLGQRLNTHSQWLGAQLFQHGYVVSRQTAVDDAGTSIVPALAEAMARADLIITTGGLGPTSDDRTRDLIAELLHRPLHEDESVKNTIETFFAGRGRAMPENVYRQALVPEGATVLANAFGTAPGLALSFPRSIRGSAADASSSLADSARRDGLLIMLPGPPPELHPMFIRQALPLITATYPLQYPLVWRSVRTTGLGESFVEQKIAAPLAHLTNDGLELAYCAHPGAVDVRMSNQGAHAARMVEEAEKIVSGVLAEWIFTRTDETLETVVVRWLRAHELTVATAESCTGGLIGHRLTNVPGASAVFLGGFVTYANAAKENLLGVSSTTLAEHGAVSQRVAREMAEGARRVLQSDYALAVTGVAGPGGGTEAKPVGTVYVACASRAGTKVKRLFLPYDRETFKEVAAQQSLDLLRRKLEKELATGG